MIPTWFKWAYTLMVCVIVPVYWRNLGPTNFLWFSDVALLTLVPALWLESRFLASTMAVGVLFLEVGWILDVLSGGNLTGIAAYMFTEEDRYIDVLSGTFHVVLPFTLLYMLARLGYDRRALPAQIILTLVMLPATYLITDPADNINWVFGPREPQDVLHPWLYLGLEMLFFVGVIYIPSHLLFKRVFRRRPPYGVSPGPGE